MLLDGGRILMGDNSAPRIGPYGAILDIAKTLVAGDSEDVTLRLIVENVGRAMFAESASLGSYRPEENTYVYEAGWREGGLTDDDKADVGRVYPLAENPDLRRQLESREIMECRIDDPGLSSTDREYLVRWGLKTSLDCPLVYGGKVIGLLGIEESRFVRRYTPSERGLFSQLCDLAAVGIHSARQARLLDEARREISRLRHGQSAAGTGQ
jgi:GAF domain-containing protein